MATPTIWRSFVIGITCGLRSMAGPAAARWRAGDPARLAFAAMAAGEFIADKLPGVPKRTIPPALVFRAIAGAYSGASVARTFKQSRLTGALAGVAGAVLATYVGLNVRSQVTRRTGIPDPVVALMEDALVIYLGRAATRS